MWTKDALQTARRVINNRSRELYQPWPSDVCKPQAIVPRRQVEHVHGFADRRSGGGAALLPFVDKHALKALLVRFFLWQRCA